MKETAELGQMANTHALPFVSDLAYVTEGVGSDWQALRNQSVLITGGTGMIGKWLIATVLHADTLFGLGVRLTVVSRAPESFRAAHPVFGNDPRITWIKGDVSDFALENDYAYPFVIHAATDVVNVGSPSSVLRTCVAGTEHVLKHARERATSRLLLLSSGAVYGKCPPDMGPIPETFTGALDCLSVQSVYAEGKRCSELMCAIENEREGIHIPVARCFAMVGPYLPLDKHFAIGNFIQSAINNEDIVIKGDGTPVRSYLYMADVVLRLWKLLFKGQGGRAYNVGGDEPLTIAALAQRVLDVLGSSVDVVVQAKPLHGAHANEYYPDTSRIRDELKLAPALDLAQAIRKTAEWYR